MTNALKFSTANARISLLSLALLGTISCGDQKAEQVEAQKVSMKNSGKIATIPTRSTYTTAAEKFCYWNDKKYSDGAMVCDSKRRFKCWTDKWVDIGNC
ncbi:DUF1496 domain-containing protein [Sphingomonas sp.]|uniref:DUF1496 domain-containing protein n=1 Tax=Sphingomonas sp. TaxID=28214 RepID=UPI00286B49E7|nr:DUF1496 domain-containing protein [Sphingomonas sp.]